MILNTKTVEKPWGVGTLPTPFDGNSGQERIGEIWFEPPGMFDQLLIKYIFTSEALSVQVHPNDAQTEAAGEGRQGKDECWLIVSAEPGAKLAIGFDWPVDAETMRAAAEDGSIEDMLAWHTVQPGDFFYIPANTVHAIGAGIGLIEVQQNSDITYRLYDYGRPRKLHLDRGINVASGQPHDPELRWHIDDTGAVTLVDGPLFRLDRFDGPPTADVVARYAGKLLVIPQSGDVTVAGETIAPGQCALAVNMAAIAFADHAKGLIAQPFSICS